MAKESKFRIGDITMQFTPDEGTCTFERTPMVMMWISSTLRGLMSGFQRMVGTRRFVLAMTGEGRDSVEGDWGIIGSKPSFEEGFAAIAAIAAVSGWGRWHLESLDRANKEAVFRVWNSWESLYQVGAVETWGSPMLAGKMAGFCSHLFGVNCWAEQTKSAAAGAAYDEFVVRPSDRSIERELGELLKTDQATRADMAIALHRLELEIVERRKTEAKLITAKSCAEDASRAKSEFLANMSHEIRTPMAAIIGFTELLSEMPDLPPKALLYAATIKRNGEHLHQLINDILDLSRIEARKLEIDQETFPLAKLLEDLRTTIAESAARKGLYLKFEIDSGVPGEIHTDSQRLRQILFNIIGNAVKFTEHGGVTVSVDIDTDPEQKFLRISVVDTGIGMSEKQLSNLFIPFAPGDLSLTKAHGGTGLGLAISKRLIDLLGGTAAVTSSWGRGTTFVTRIPLSPQQPARTDSSDLQGVPKSQKPQDTRLAGRVLLVEDQIDTRELLKIILEKFGLEVTTAETGAAAVTMASEDGGFALVIMDVQMPVMDGLTATRELRRRGYHKPIIALTAFAMVGDRERCMEAGCNDYISKPVNQQKLFATLQPYLFAGANAPAPPNTAPH